MSLLPHQIFICTSCLNNQEYDVGQGCVMCGHSLTHIIRGTVFAKYEVNWYRFTFGGYNQDREHFYQPYDYRYPKDKPKSVLASNLEFYDIYKYIRRIK